jgi:hypothetical protein
LGSSGTAEGLAACEQGNEPTDTLKSGVFFDHPSDH